MVYILSKQYPSWQSSTDLEKNFSFKKNNIISNQKFEFLCLLKKT